VASNPPADLVLAPINGEARPIGEWLTMFDLALVALDPFTNESAWILRTARRILTHYDQADVRVAWLVTGTPAEARMFLGPYAKEILTFADPERKAVEGLGLTALPAMVHVNSDGTIRNAAEGWFPKEWDALTEALSRKAAWTKPVVPIAGDPAPFPGTNPLAEPTA
jgi:hypothetical protein